MRTRSLQVSAMLLVGGAIALVPCTVSAAPLSAAHVVALGKAADGTVVELEGEAVGEALRAQDGKVWVNVSSGGTAVGVVTSERSARAIDAYGRYGWTGSIVRVRGVLNVACDEHGGDLDVHATSFAVVSPGQRRARTVPWWQLGAAATLFATAALALAARARLRHRYDVGKR